MALTRTIVRELVTRIEADITERAIPTGSLLGTEPELCARYHVSSTTLRQAARLLESRNVAAMRPGNRGGLVVRGSALDGAAKTLAIFLEFTDVSVAEAHAVAALAFGQAAQVCARAMTLDAADNIRAGLKRIANLPTAFERGTAFISVFEQFVDSARNPLLAFTFRVTNQILYDITTFDKASLGQFDATAKVADTLFEGVIGGDLHATNLAVRHWVELHRALPPRTAPNGKVEPFIGGGGAARTRSEQLARHMLGEIRNSGWSAGTRIGGEQDLLQRYGVSSATFRQAVRLLEQYSAVSSRRGLKGGLFVSSADPQRVDALAVAVLREEKLSGADLQAFSSILAGFTLDEAMRRDRQGLARCLGSAGSAAEPNLAVTIGRLHHDLAELSGNRLAQALVRITTALETALGTPAADRDWTLATKLLAQANRAFRAKDQSRLKRAILELTNTFGHAGALRLEREA